MREVEVIHIALENLKKTTQIECAWNTDAIDKLDGELTLYIENEDWVNLD